MSIFSAGKTIKEARLKAGKTQEQLSEGICSVLSLSRIENGSAGVSPVTFQALMSHAGVPCELYPIFANRTDFDCFYTLKRAQFYLDSWQLGEAYNELKKVEASNFANNKLYYQEWLYLHGSIQVKSGYDNHNEILAIFKESLFVTRPELDFSDIKNLLLSITEIRVLTEIAHEMLYTDMEDEAYLICSQIKNYIKHTEMDYLSRDRLNAECAIVYTKYLLKTKDYKTALKTADLHRHRLVENSEFNSLLELTFLTSLSYHYMGNEKESYRYFKNTFYSAHSVESCFATVCKDFVIKHNIFSLDEYLLNMDEIPMVYFPVKKATNIVDLSDGTYDFSSPDILTIGKLIKELRKEQKLSQIVLCQGLCSKSKLSKIENETLQPDIFLTEALLQRLGISERVLSFWGNERESALYELKFKLAHSRLLTNTQRKKYIDDFRSLLSKDDNILMQISDFDCTAFIQGPNEKILNLRHALSYTLPDFDIRRITDYRLSDMELCILSSIAFGYRTIDFRKGNTIFSRLIDYIALIKPDTMLTNLILPLIMYKYFNYLYLDHHYSDLVNLFNSLKLTIFKNKLSGWGYILFYYCQSLGEIGQYNLALKYATYSCNIQELYELMPNSDVLRKYLFQDFSIEIP